MTTKPGCSSSIALLTAAFIGAAVLPTLQACAPMVVAAGVGAGVGAGALVATDRRSAGSQVDDEAIEVKLATNINNRWGNTVHVNVTSYNGVVLLTGEVPDAATKAALAELARTTDRVRRVHDEIAVRAPTPMSERTNDTYITSKVKARFVEAKSFSANHVKVVTEQNVVYLMGIVRPVEGDEAVHIARTTSGVERVVKLFEYFQG